MALTAGSRLGPYEIQAPLGAGGRGEVYRARDTRLRRDVAIKILPEAFVADADRVARFEREAQVLASLNHPHIAAIHGLEDAGGQRALVLEFVDGPTLADRLAEGAMSLEDALPIAKQIADALEAAHEQGIVHRDLKPANVKIRPDGTVKVLDFGLAKALDPPHPTQGLSRSSASMSPTLTAATQLGMILGTAAYMAPEQARGKPVDKRADIWAFGCVLFEMLSGRRAFAGEEVSDTLAFVITKDVDWNALPASTPAHIGRLLRRCLEKDPKKRLRDIGDARIELDGLVHDEPATPSHASAAPRPSLSRRALPWVGGTVVGAAAAAAVVWTLSRPAPVSLRPVQRFVIDFPASGPHVGDGGGGGNLAISPDGTRLVFMGIEAGRRLLFMRNLDQIDVQPIRGTDDANNPFFSPDGEWIGFFTAPGTPGGKLKKVAVRGGPPLTIADANIPTGTWARDDSIVFTRGTGANWSLFRVPAAGGGPMKLTTPNADQKEVRHGWPDVLPDGQHVLFSISPSPRDFDQASIAVLSLATGEYRTVVPQGYNARYVSTGHLVYALAGNLMAIPFDLDRLETTGSAVPVVEGVRGRISIGEVTFGISSSGFLVYSPGSMAAGVQRTMVWVDREGKEEPIPAPPRAYAYVRLSPDGSRVAMDVRDQENDIWAWDLVRRNLTRLTTDAGNDIFPVWTPDGARIIFGSDRASAGGIYWQPADGSGSAERLLEGQRQQSPNAITPDGKQLLFREAPSSGPTSADVNALHLDDRRARPLLHTTFNEMNAELSPDGRWVAYQSNESGQQEIYVRPFPNVDSGRWTVSTGGGTRPLWSRDGRELFYLAGGDSATRMMATPIQPGNTFAAGNARMLFEGPYYATFTPGGNSGRTYDVSLDGKRFLMIKNAAPTSSAATPSSLVAVLNFYDELKRLAPPKR